MSIFTEGPKQESNVEKESEITTVPQLTPVKSSNVEAVGFCDKTNCIFVRFKGGGVYRYQNCDQAMFDDLMKAESVGKFVHANLKSKRFTKQ